jgi:AcrR family transcriptional regulator
VFIAVKSPATNARLLTAARSQMQRVGGRGVSLRAVAREANIAPSAVYRHFKNKEALVEAVTKSAVERFAQSLWRAVAPLPVGSLERLAQLGREYINFALTHPADFAVLFSPTASGPRALEDLPGKGGFEILRQCVAEAMDAGVLKRADPALVSLLLWTRVHGIVHLLGAIDFRDEIASARGAKGPAAIFEATSPMIFAGIAARKRP